MYDNPLLLIAVIVATGLAFVFAPVAIDAYRKFRDRKVITCPEAQSPAEVNLDAGRAALAAGVGRSLLRIKSCSLWPKRKGCDEKCVGENWPG